MVDTQSQGSLRVGQTSFRMWVKMTGNPRTVQVSCGSSSRTLCHILGDGPAFGRNPCPIYALSSTMSFPLAILGSGPAPKSFSDLYFTPVETCGDMVSGELRFVALSNWNERRVVYLIAQMLEAVTLTFERRPILMPKISSMVKRWKQAKSGRIFCRRVGSACLIAGLLTVHVSVENYHALQFCNSTPDPHQIEESRVASTVFCIPSIASWIAASLGPRIGRSTSANGLARRIRDSSTYNRIASRVWLIHGIVLGNCRRWLIGWRPMWLRTQVSYQMSRSFDWIPAGTSRLRIYKPYKRCNLFG
ncbi:hypothetical protein FB45DRAFT_1002400, partial [Roridomyces roridus]